MSSDPLYQQLADHYRHAIGARTLAPGDRMPSVRTLMATHGVSLSTALQACRQLEREGLLQARPRSGYFVCAPARPSITSIDEPTNLVADPAQYIGIHERISYVLARSQQESVKFNLGGASAAAGLYPIDALRNAARRALQRDPMLYGEAVKPRGHDPLRTALARLALAMRVQLSPDEILITHGCTEALQLALRAVANPGDVVAVESPTYYGLLQILESLGVRALEIPCSAQTGISLEALELAVRSYKDIKAVVAMPNLQNPLGSIMPDEQKATLVQWCEKNGIALIEDDCSSATADSDMALRAAKSWDRSGNVIYCSSLHKVLAPGMRLGWIAGGKWHARIEMLKFALSRPNEMLTQTAVAEFIVSGGYERHLRRLRAALKRQRDWMAQAVATSFPPGTKLSVPRGGMHLWVELPDGTSSEQVFERALQEGVYVAPGVIFSNSGRFEPCLRINCGSPRSAGLEEAVAIVAAVARKVAREAMPASGAAPVESAFRTTVA
ncbi:aminotransferase-like domain-containing protein [Paraburkholderia solisilvae]|uniref:Histidinol-phosphate aminotransferase n=1 Tax=Paraburkholderia solisilvae TaxID=624376 RepID=A0A6J5DLH8_9BURK|nr:PLP-dependent aminotransferase family protein [Paraburkholderia solisilvae]CAB3754101.1 Histidinol-phosphate aminotransferase [Paraburkholderia solisilvae]